ncbi:Thaumatin-like protein [Quillaja saponaria]|uniref:Thaumatin-like protein n=1 Tax=Quillaja saponaria TaxID=32244 RepID=A0AAD7Q424_QUISA|nr:Thaumatin-like protein [Quillaja saponaria]
MQLPQFIASYFLFFLVCHSILSGNAIAHTVTFFVHNKCPFPIWPATAANTDQPIIADGGFHLPPGKTQRIDAPWSWSGRIWARTGCNFAWNWKPACETGDCDGRLACNGLAGTPPVTLIQISLQGDKGKSHSFAVSLVDGYNIPVSVTPSPLTPKCGYIQGCLKNLNSLCPHELQVWNDKGEIVACKSACLAFDLDKFCCRNEYGIPEKCKPNVYSKIFKDACPSYFSYAFDTTHPLLTCACNAYVITFCPSTWGGEAGGFASM